MAVPAPRTNPLYPTDNIELEEKLQSSLNMVDYFIRRSYLSQLSACPVCEFPQELTSQNIRLFHVGKIIYDEQEEINEKLISVYSALQSCSAAVHVLLVGKPTGVEFYIGTSSKDAAGIPADILNQSFLAHFPGSSTEPKENSEIRALLENQCFDNISSVTVVPSIREDNDKQFVQGMEKVIDSMQGKEFFAMFVSRPISQEELSARKLGLEQIYSAISPYAKMSLAYGENHSDAVTKGTFRNFTESVSEGISNTIGESVTVTESSSHGSGAMGLNSSHGKSVSKAGSWSDTESKTTSKAKGTGVNNSDTVTTGTSQTFTNEVINKTVENIMTYIDEQLERIQHFESFGAWETAAYFCAGRIENSLVAASTFKALVSGEKTHTECSAINVWNSDNPNTPALAKYLQYCQHPRFLIPGGDFLGARIVTPGNYVSGKELPVFMSLPQKSVAGITVTTMAEFSRNISREAGCPNDAARTIRLGCMRHMGRDEPSNIVSLDMDSLTSHCFICGSTGSGKSNTVYHLLQTLHRKGVPFLVIEPAKGEYKTTFGKVPGLHIFNTNPSMGAMLKINPFEFDSNIHVFEHLDRLIEIFNACWEMYAAMPAILKNAIEKAYIRKGWDLQNSIYMKDGAPQFPTFADVLDILPQIIRSSAYSADTQGDYTGALVTRVESLTNGITGQIFCDNYYIPDAVLFDENVIVDLSRVGSAETKSLIMGILVMRLNEYRMARATGSNKSLQHVTVLEEAHHLLKNVSQVQGQQNANPIGKSVEMICNSIAEMRTYGEGFIIVDQSPSSVDIAAIKNTNTKIAMRLPEKNDCEAIGSSLSLNEKQVKELSKLPVGVAVVLQNNWLEAVLCKISRANEERYKLEPETNSFSQLRKFRGAVLEALVTDFKTNKTVNLAHLEAVIHGADVSAPAKNEMMCRIKALEASLTQSDSADCFYVTLLYLSGLRGIFIAAESEIAGHEGDKPIVSKWWNQLLNQCELMFAFSDSAMAAMLLRRCLYAMKWQASRVNYELAYRTLHHQG